MENATTEVRNLDNASLRLLLKEIREIGNHHQPRYVKQSALMKSLFKLEDEWYKDLCWADKYNSVRNAIQNEILFRVLKDKF